MKQPTESVAELGVDFALTEEQKLIRDTARKITEKFPPEHWREIDAKGEYPSEFWNELGKQGFLGIAVPAKYGGGGLGLLDMAIVVEEVAHAGAGLDGSNPFLNGPVFGSFSIAKYCNEDLKQKYLPGLAKGDVLALGLTESEAGSNITRVKTFAKKDGSDYVVNGHKIFISMMHQAKTLLLVARTKPFDQVERKTDGITLFLVDLPSPSIRLSPWEKAGMHTMNTNDVYVENLRLPETQVMGQVDQGWEYLLDVLNPERIIIAAMSIGTGLLAIEKAVEYAKQRVVWDRPIGAHQGIQFPLADSISKLEAARLMTYKAAWLFDQGQPCGLEAAYAKAQAVQAGQDATDRAMQTFGGMGYMRDADVERHWRNMRLMKLAPITQEMTLNYIARQGLGLPRSY
jgi:acyl-CoA dehydrogenase